MISKIKIYGYRVYNQFILEPNQKLNLIVGANEAGKSTLMEAITLALTGRVNGRYASEDLNPYWFNTTMVNDFLCKLQSGTNSPLPEIRIELFFDDRAELQQLCGAINTDVPTTACPGIAMRAYPNPDYSSEIDEWKKNPSHLLPVEYYALDWRSFADEKITRRPRQLSTAVIDSRTVRSLSGVDYHMRQILGDHLEPAERAEISLAFRQMKASMSETSLSGVNDRIGGLHAALHDRPMALAMDQSARTSWESSVIPHVDNVPFSMSGQGQQAAIKISLAMSRHSGATNFVMVEEPENHLTHTSLTTLISRIRSLASDEQQLFVTTHSSFVLNRLGLDALLLVENSLQSRIPDLDPETVSYFQKLPGYDTLRMILAKKVVLVEGPSDEIIFERIFSDLHGKQPMECGIDVLSMRGLSLRRCLELCASVDKKVAALRDNDGDSPKKLRQAVQSWLKEGKREIFIGEVEHGETLEPQLIHHNGESSLRKILGIRADAELATWMKREKTEGAIRIASTAEGVQPPKYMVDAARFIYG